MQKLDKTLVMNLLGRSASVMVGTVMKSIDHFSLVDHDLQRPFIQGFGPDGSAIGPKYRLVSTDEISEQERILAASDKQFFDQRVFKGAQSDDPPLLHKKAPIIRCCPE